MKINFFSPLPPLLTDIANMSASILFELGKLAQVRAWTSQNAWSSELGSTYEICRFDPQDLPAKDFNWADISFFNIGNDARFHKDIFDVCRVVSGVQILHDVRLAHFFAAYAEGSDSDREFYKREMGQEGLGEEAIRFLAGQLSFEDFLARASMTSSALRPAIAAIFHNETELKALEHHNMPLFFLPLCLSSGLGAPPIKRQYEDSSSRIIRLVVFGFIGKNRCLPEVLQALAGAAQRDRYLLDIYGTLEEPLLIERLVKQLQLESQVVCHGFVKDEVLEAGLAMAELAINLRNPTVGEASGSQLKIWANELPALVSDAGWYASLPRHSVFHIIEGDEVSGIQKHLAALRSDPEPYRKAGRIGRKILERDHRPETYAQSLLEISEQAPALFGRKAATTLARRSASLLMEATRRGPFSSSTRSIATLISEITYGSNYRSIERFG